MGILLTLDDAHQARRDEHLLNRHLAQLRVVVALFGVEVPADIDAEQPWQQLFQRVADAIGRLGKLVRLDHCRCAVHCAQMDVAFMVVVVLCER
jgi:hypothetical protein